MPFGTLCNKPISAVLATEVGLDIRGWEWKFVRDLGLRLLEVNIKRFAEGRWVGIGVLEVVDWDSR